MLRTLVTWREVTGDRSWDKVIRELVGGLSRIAVRRGDYAYYPDGGFGEPFNYPRSGWVRTDEPKTETEGGEGSTTAYQAHQIQGLARWYALSGDTEALDLARRLTRFCMLPKFWGGVPDTGGRVEGLVGHVSGVLPDQVGVAGAELGHWYSHFHARAIVLRGIMEYARVAGDWPVLEFVRRAYEYIPGRWASLESAGSTAIPPAKPTTWSRGVHWGIWWRWGSGSAMRDWVTTGT